MSNWLVLMIFLGGVITPFALLGLAYAITDYVDWKKANKK